MTDQDTNQEERLDVYHQMELYGEDLEQYNELGLPHVHPHLLAKAMLAQLERLPLMELERDTESFSEHTVALSA